MPADLLARIERDLSRMSDELWNIDGPDDILNGVLKKVSLLKAQLEVQKSLQATANLLRRQPSDKALPKQQATKVKHLIRFAFRENSRQELPKRGEEGKEGEGEEGRHRKLRKLDCDALKLCGLSYTTEEIVKLGNAEFEILQRRGAEFISYRNLSYLLYRPDVDKAVDSKLEDPEDAESFDKFMQIHTTRRLSTQKRKYDAIASPNEASQAPTKKNANTNWIEDDNKTEPNQVSAKTKKKTTTYAGDAFIVDIGDARFALSLDEHVGEVWLTNPESKYNAHDEKKRSFLTLWVSEAMGRELGRRSKPMVYHATDEEVQSAKNEDTATCLHEQPT